MISFHPVITQSIYCVALPSFNKHLHVVRCKSFKQAHLTTTMYPVALGEEFAEGHTCSHNLYQPPTIDKKQGGGLSGCCLRAACGKHLCLRYCLTLCGCVQLESTCACMSATLLSICAPCMFNLQRIIFLLTNLHIKYNLLTKTTQY